MTTGTRTKTDEWNLEELFDLQAAIDSRIIDKFKLNVNEINKDRKLALLVELYEMLNEWKGFKYWKQNVQIDRDKLLEEFVDVLHFLLSFGNYYGVPPVHYYVDNRKTITETALTLNTSILLMDGGIYWITSFAYYRGLADQLGFSKEEIEEAYRAKNAENHARQDRNY